MRLRSSFVTTFLDAALLLVRPGAPFLVSFASVSSFSPVRLLRLVFWSPYSLIGCSDFSSPLSVSSFGYWLRFFFSLFFFLVCLLQEFPLPFASFFHAYQSFCFIRLCVVTCDSPFSSFLLARLLLLRGFTAYLVFRLLGSNFLVRFLSTFPAFVFRSFSSES